MQTISIENAVYVLVPFASLDSFSRTYENLRQYARSKGFRELPDDIKEQQKILAGVRSAYPQFQRIALGKTLPGDDWSDSTERFLVVTFPDQNPHSSPSSKDSINIDITFCEDEFEDAVCVFMQKQP